MTIRLASDGPQTVRADTIGAAWLAVAQRILTEGVESRYDGLPVREIALVTLVVNHPGPADEIIAAHAEPERLAWMHANFTELGMELEGKGQIEGLVADRTVGLDGVRTEIAMMRTPDGHGKLELTRYLTPAAVGAGPENAPPNTLGLHRVMFAVDDIHDTIARLRPHGAELLGEVAQYENLFLLCYLRGPAGIIVALAEQLS